MMVYVLTLYDPGAQFGYTEVFAELADAMRYAGVKNWKKRGDTYTWNDGETSVRMRKDLLCWTTNTEIYKIRKRRLRGHVKRKGRRAKR